MNELKPCPFCGKPGSLLHYPGDGYLPECSDPACCGMVEIWFATEEEAAEAWNRRAET